MSPIFPLAAWSRLLCASWRVGVISLASLPIVLPFEPRNAVAPRPASTLSDAYELMTRRASSTASGFAVVVRIAHASRSVAAGLSVATLTALPRSASFASSGLWPA
eukprot:3122288-Prymnesium_polylepis.1